MLHSFNLVIEVSSHEDVLELGVQIRQHIISVISHGRWCSLARFCLITIHIHRVSRYISWSLIFLADLLLCVLQQLLVLLD